CGMRQMQSRWSWSPGRQFRGRSADPSGRGLPAATTIPATAAFRTAAAGLIGTLPGRRGPRHQDRGDSLRGGRTPTRGGRRPGGPNPGRNEPNFTRTGTTTSPAGFRLVELAADGRGRLAIFELVGRESGAASLGLACG